MAQFRFHQHITLAHKYLKTKPISLVNQQIRMQYLYRKLLVENYIKDSMFVCVLDIQPSSESQVYRIKIAYKLSDGAPKAWLISPPLQKYEGKYPHHKYGKDNNGNYQLCVYYPKYKEWNKQMYIANSFVPWVCTWLSTYEYWLVTGNWHYDEILIGQN